MPAASIAVIATWTLRLVRLRGVRKTPLVMTSKAIHTTTSTPTSPSDRERSMSRPAMFWR